MKVERADFCARTFEVHVMLVQLTKNRLIGNLSNGNNYQIPSDGGHKQLKGKDDIEITAVKAYGNDLRCNDAIFSPQRKQAVTIS